MHTASDARLLSVSRYSIPKAHAVPLCISYRIRLLLVQILIPISLFLRLLLLHLLLMLLHRYNHTLLNPSSYPKPCALLLFVLLLLTSLPPHPPSPRLTHSLHPQPLLTGPSTPPIIPHLQYLTAPLLQPHLHSFFLALRFCRAHGPKAPDIPDTRILNHFIQSAPDGFSETVRTAAEGADAVEEKEAVAVYCEGAGGGGGLRAVERDCSITALAAFCEGAGAVLRVVEGCEHQVSFSSDIKCSQS